ncbi:hypothetical protein [Altericroceibacterium endophyticum]|uniref:Uncharacterized protein n=1 Tax=Altericroceibacterium endophyticum TaxID=1808508 RepID=A0A6I4T7U5_9SPHN|nr:hypothetical protein [Altericroceibacterium endophyticum]MXO66063.1 hypothetical protein [Altericroceibacterium endophyticum]
MRDQTILTLRRIRLAAWLTTGVTIISVLSIFATQQVLTNRADYTQAKPGCAYSPDTHSHPGHSLDEHSQGTSASPHSTHPVI